MRTLYIFTVAILFSSLKFNAQTTPPYNQEFTTFLPSGWTKVNGGSIASGPGSSFGTWSQGTFLNQTSGSGAAKVQLYTSNQMSWLITNSFNLQSGTNYTVSFNYGATNWYSQTTPSNTQIKDDVFSFLVSSDGGTTWSALQTWNSPNSTMTNTSTLFSINLSNISGNNVKFAFLADDGLVFFPGGIDIFIDNFKIEASNLSTAEATISKNKIYPNPTDGRIFVANKKDVKSLEVLNVVGQKIMDLKTNEADLTNMKSGIYFVKITFNDGSISVEKIIRK